MVKKNIKMFFDPLQSEQGSIIVVAMLFLVILTLIGISATSTSTVELQIAANDQLQRIAFCNADSGIYGTPKLISNTVDTMSEPPVAADTGSIAPGIGYLPNDGSYVADTFFRQVAGYDAYDNGKDVSFAIGGISAEVDVERTGQQNLVGGGVEFGSGSQGIGAGAGAGGVAIFYDMDADGTGPRNSSANISAQYRKIVGVPGGL